MCRCRVSGYRVATVVDGIRDAWGELTMPDFETRTAVAPRLPNGDPVGSLERLVEGTEALLTVAPETAAPIR